MKTKKCSKCKQVKNLSEFGKQKRYKGGYNCWCKECCNEYGKEHYKLRPIKIKNCEICNNEFKVINKNNQKYCSKECYEIAKTKKHKIWQKENKEKLKKHRKKYIKKYKKTNQEKYRQKRRKYNKKYIRTHKKEINKYMKQRKNENINFRIACNLRNRVYLAIKGNWKYGHTLELLDCSVDELRKYIESLFKPGMTWQNWGKWHIDHIKPCISFDLSKESEQRKCFHYSNLQPLWAKENLRKGGRY